MNKKLKIILLSSGVLFFLILSILAVKFVLDTPYRSKLPIYPDFKTISKSLQQQIKDAGSKASYNPTVQNIGNLGLVYHANGYSEKAAACYQLALQRSSGKDKVEWVWSYYLGCLNLEQGESKAAIENFKSVTAVNPKNYQAYFYNAEACQNLGYTDEAKRLFKKVYSINDDQTVIKKTMREFYFPVQIHAGYSLAQIYLNSNQPDSAELILKEIIKKKWTFGPAYHLLGEVYTKMGNPELAKKFIIRSGDMITNVPYADTLLDKIALISRSEKYLLKQIESAKRSYNFKWEFQICTHSMECIPDNKYVISNILSMYFFFGKDKDAMPLIDQHFKNYKEDFDEIFKFSDLLYGKGHEPEALKYFNQAKKLQPGNSRLAIWLLDKGKKEQALQLINEQLQGDPGNERILTDAIHLYVTLGEKEKANSLLPSLKRLFPSNIEAKKATGLLLEMDGNLKDAIPIYEEVSKEKDLSIIKYLSSIYLKYQNWDKAIKNFKLGLESFPNETELLEPLGRILISCPEPKLLDIEAGREYSERAYTHFNCPVGTRILAARNLATAYAILGDKQMASNYINATLNLVQQINVDPQQYVGYFEMLRQKYRL